MTIWLTAHTACPGNATLDRVIDSMRLTPAWSRGGSAEDALLAFPLAIAADERLVYVIDAGTRRLVALDAHTGQPAWTSSTEEGAPRRLIQPAVVAGLPGISVTCRPFSCRRRMPCPEWNI